MASIFVLSTAEEKQGKRLKLNSSKTLQENKGAAKVFKEYLKVKGENENFQDFDNVKLDEMLGHFYMDLRREDGSHYKVNSLETIRHDINIYIFEVAPLQQKSGYSEGFLVYRQQHLF